MFNTSPTYIELAVLQKEDEVKIELCQINLQLQALAEPSSRNSWTAHRIAHFATWMVSAGEFLLQRYDHKAMHSDEVNSVVLSYGGAAQGTSGPLHE